MALVSWKPQRRPDYRKISGAHGKIDYSRGASNRGWSSYSRPEGLFVVGKIIDPSTNVYSCVGESNRKARSCIKQTP